MRVFDRRGEVCIVSAASLAAGNDDFLIVGARAVYISHSPLTKDQCELLKPGIIARLERMESVDCGRNVLADVPPPESGGVQPDCGSVASCEVDGMSVARRGRKHFDKLFGVFSVGEHPFFLRCADREFITHCSSFLRRVGRVVCIAFPSLTRRRKVPFVSSGSVGGGR